MGVAEEPIRIGGRKLKRGHHVCAFFNSREERDKILMPFFKEGLERGEKVFHFVDPRQRESHLQSLRDHDIGADTALESGQLEVTDWDQTYLSDGCFDGARMLEMLQTVLDANRERYTMCRIMGEMEWSLAKLPGVEDLVLYETKVNTLIADLPDPLICVYDLNQHSGSVVMDILRTHPMVILGGVLQDNPFYVPPAEFLKELQARSH